MGKWNLEDFDTKRQIQRNFTTQQEGNDNLKNTRKKYNLKYIFILRTNDSFNTDIIKPINNLKEIKERTLNAWHAEVT